MEFHHKLSTKEDITMSDTKGAGTDKCPECGGPCEVIVEEHQLQSKNGHHLSKPVPLRFYRYKGPRKEECMRCWTIQKECDDAIARNETHFNDIAAPHAELEVIARKIKTAWDEAPWEVTAEMIVDLSNIIRQLDELQKGE